MMYKSQGAHRKVSAKNRALQVIYSLYFILIYRCGLSSLPLITAEEISHTMKVTNFITKSPGEVW